MSNLSPLQVVAWCRAQARKYTEMADSLERDFGLKNPPILARPAMDAGVDKSVVSIVESLPQRGDMPTPEAIAHVIGSGNMRAKQISDRLGGIPPKDIEKVVRDNPAMFEIRERGWISATPQNISAS